MKLKVFLQKAGVALCYLTAWELASLAVGRALVLPSPLDTAGALFALALTGSFWLTVASTLLRVIAGFLAGVAAGTLFGALTGFSDVADAMLSPLRSIIKATPVTSFIILVLLWLTGALTPVFIAFLMVTPIVWASVREGIRSCDAQLIEMANVFRVPAARRINQLYAPGVMSRFVAACTTALGFAWKSGVAAEVIAKTELSVGRSLYESKLYVETAELFAWTAAVILMSILLERLMLRLLGRFSHDKA